MAKNVYSEDEALNIRLDKEYFQKPLQYIRRYKKEFFLTILIMLIATFATTAGPYIFKDTIDSKIPDKNITGLVINCLIFACTIIISGFSQFYKMKYMNFVGNSIISDLRVDVFSHIQKLPFTYFDSRPHGKILVRIVNYVNSLSDIFSTGIVDSLMDLLSFFVVLFFMFITDARLTFIVLLGLPVIATVIFTIKGAHRKAWRAYSNKSSNLNAYLHESITGVKVTQAFVRERKNLKIFNKLCVDSFRSWMKAKKIEFIIWPTVQTVSDITFCAVLYLGIIVITNKPISIGAMVAFTSYIPRLWSPILSISNIYNSLITNLAYLERISETMDEEVTVKDVKNASKLNDIEGNVEFKNVTFAYEDGVEVLKDINLKVSVGETIALVGHTGAGKTTIVNLLSRYYNLNSGSIFIDGQDVSMVTLKSLREQIGYMLQDSFIFSETIIENIRYGRLDATDEEVIEAAKLACSHDFITSLKDGYKTVVSERGSTLSAGQRQLISLARTMLKNPKILILDEATASIDTQTEQKLIQGIQTLLKGRTSFVIAHRLSTIKSADRILVIGNKGIIEEGSHDELMEKQGEYYAQYITQSLGI